LASWDNRPRPAPLLEADSLVNEEPAIFPSGRNTGHLWLPLPQDLRKLRLRINHAALGQAACHYADQCRCTCVLYLGRRGRSKGKSDPAGPRPHGGRQAGPILGSLSGCGGNHVSRTDNIIQKGPVIDWQGLLILPSLGVLLDGDHVGCARSFLALSGHELDLLSFVERCIARRLNLRVVDKQVIAAAIRGNKTKSLTRIEPFYCTCTHLHFSLACL